MERINSNDKNSPPKPSKREKTITNILRERWQLPETVTDEEIWEKSKNSLTWARVDLSMACDELKRAIKQEILDKTK